MEWKIGKNSVFRKNIFTENDGNGNESRTEKTVRIFLFKDSSRSRIFLYAGIGRTAFFLKLKIRGLCLMAGRFFLQLFSTADLHRKN